MKGSITIAILLLALTQPLASPKIAAAESSKASKVVTKKKFVYRSHTQIDLTGQTVQGKTRAPEVFYIFQRKRSEAHHVVRTPDSLGHQHDLVSDVLKGSLPK